MESVPSFGHGNSFFPSNNGKSVDVLLQNVDNLPTPIKNLSFLNIIAAMCKEVKSFY